MTLSEAIDLLKNSEVDDCTFEARQIFSEIGGVPPYMLASRSFSTDDEAVISAVKRRAAGEPLGYILGSVCLFRETYKVTPAVLIPRPDTEILIECAVKNLPIGAEFIDLCTGSGCVAISVLNNTENTTAQALDISPEAISLACENSMANGTDKRLTFTVADVFTYKTKKKFDAILSNPPYIKENVYKDLQKEIFFEPKIAFIGGEDGLKFYRAITKAYKGNLKENGFIAYEIGYDQGDELRAVADENGFSCEIIKDLAGNDRVAVLRLNK